NISIMHNKFRALSLSYKVAPVEIREIISLDEKDVHSILLKLKEFFSVTDTLILSTCNRTEVYYSHELDLSTEIIKLIGLEKGLEDVVSYLDYFRIYNDDREAIHHLFRVAMGLEAQEIGRASCRERVQN